MDNQKTILEKLFDGEIRVAEYINLNHNQEYTNNWKDYCEVKTSFASLLTPEQKEAFNNLIDSRTLLASTESQIYFQQGFCIGARLMMEIMQTVI